MQAEILPFPGTNVKLQMQNRTKRQPVRMASAPGVTISSLHQPPRYAGIGYAGPRLKDAARVYQDCYGRLALISALEDLIDEARNQSF